MKKKLYLIAAFIFLTLIPPFFSYASIRTITGTVTKVSDGDTIQLTTAEHTKLRVRLYGIDAPETDKINNHTGRVSKSGQSYGEESWKALKNIIMWKQVRLDILDIDRYHRMVGIIWLNNRNINLEIIREGNAEAYIEYLKPPYRSEFLKAEREARSAKKGIWSLQDYERPKDFRKRLKVRGAE